MKYYTYYNIEHFKNIDEYKTLIWCTKNQEKSNTHPYPIPPSTGAPFWENGEGNPGRGGPYYYPV